MGSRKRRLLLVAASSDRTFVLKEHNGDQVLEGKCIHCGRKLALYLDGTPLGDASVEHIVPKNHGGTDDVENLAVACSRCNAEKGLRHDHKSSRDPKLQEIIARLQRRRRARLKKDDRPERSQIQSSDGDDPRPTK